MFSKRSFTSLMAVSVGLALAGCAGLPTDVLGPLTANLTPQQSAAVQSMVNDSLYATQSDTRMDMANAYASDSSMTTQALEVGVGTSASASTSTMASASAQASASFGLNFEHFRARLKDRLNQHRAEVHGVTHASVTNADGSTTVTFAMSLDHKNGAEAHTIARTYAVDKSLVAIKAHFERTNADGFHIVIERDRTLNADGTWSLSFNSVITRKDGKTKTVVWTRTEASDGSQTGSGTITRFDGSTESMTCTKTSDGSEVSKTVDSQTNVATQVSQSDASTDASVQVSNATSGQVTGSTTVTNTDQVEPSNQ